MSSHVQLDSKVSVDGKVSREDVVEALKSSSNSFINSMCGNDSGYSSISIAYSDSTLKTSISLSHYDRASFEADSNLYEDLNKIYISLNVTDGTINLSTEGEPGDVIFVGKNAKKNEVDYIDTQISDLMKRREVIGGKVILNNVDVLRMDGIDSELSVVENVARRSAENYNPILSSMGALQVSGFKTILMLKHNIEKTLSGDITVKEFETVSNQHIAIWNSEVDAAIEICNIAAKSIKNRMS